ncbi:MAG: hypothetical protein K2G38_04815 [Clostridia bacterium]|nr:hypothetical protein [Clostridia bacterium]
MKRLIASLITVIISVGFCSFLGCSKKSPEKELEGIYVLQYALAEGQGYPLTYSNKKDENDIFINVIGGYVDHSEYTIKLKDGKMTIRGSIAHGLKSDGHKFSFVSEYVKEYNYSFVTSEINPAWYTICTNGDESPYQIIHAYDKFKAHLVYEYGENTETTSRVFYYYEKQD